MPITAIIQARDSSGATATQEITITVASLDNTVPTTPGTVTLVSRTQSSITFQWTASTDANSILRYNVWRSTTQSGTYSLRDTCTTNSYTDVGLGAGQTFWYRISAVDHSGNENESARSTAASLSTTSTASNLRKWHPGHYLKTQGNQSATGSGQTSYINGVNNTIDNLVSDVRGAFVTFAWGVVEPAGWVAGTGPGEFDFTPVKTMLDKLQALGKKAIICIGWKNSGTSAEGWLAPKDLSDAGYVIPRSNGAGFVAKVYLSNVMTRFIAMMNAFAVQFDSHPALEAFFSEESAPTLAAGTPPSTDYTAAGLSTQLQRLVQAGATAFQHTNFVLDLNSLGGQVNTLMESVWANRVGRGSPDAILDNGAVCFQGLQAQGESAPPPRDYRATTVSTHVNMPHIVVGSVLAFSQRNATQILSQLADPIKYTHLCWISTAGGTNTWASILSAISANPTAIRTIFPDRYTGETPDTT